MLTDRFLKGRKRGGLTSEERAELEGAIASTRTVPARTVLVEPETRVRQATLLLGGVMCRYFEDIQGLRQLVAVHVSGDFVDLHGYPLRELDHQVATISACEVAFIPHSALDAIMAGGSGLARQLWYSTMLDAAMHRAWLFRLGRLDAAGRVAHLFCELNSRLRAVGLTTGQGFALPLTQLDLAEACGLTSVHVNRVLRQLREEGLCIFRSGTVEIIDRRRLAARGQFDPNYLYLDDSAPYGALSSAA